VASTAIRPVLTVPGTARVLGTSAYATWLLVAGAVVVVSTRDATRLPNSVEISATAHDDVFRSVGHGDRATMRANRISFDHFAVSVTRWWDPRPALPACTAESLARTAAGLPDQTARVPSDGLRLAVANGSPPQLLHAAEELLGRGTGLTPAGDDYLAGALAALRLLGPVCGLTAPDRLLTAVRTPLLHLARQRTTAFSATLLEHAIGGRVAAPAAALLRALTGRGDVATTHRGLGEVGHSSGPALAAGIVLGTQSLIHWR
jgi:hypothetical protein